MIAATIIVVTIIAGRTNPSAWSAGDTKWRELTDFATSTVDGAALGLVYDHLEHLRAPSPAPRITNLPNLLLFSRSGFTPDLTRLAAGRSDIELIDTARLYHGA